MPFKKIKIIRWNKKKYFSKIKVDLVILWQKLAVYMQILQISRFFNENLKIELM